MNQKINITHANPVIQIFDNKVFYFAPGKPVETFNIPDGCHVEVHRDCFVFVPDERIEEIE